MTIPNFQLNQLQSGSRWSQGTTQLSYSFVNDETDNFYVTDFGYGQNISPLSGQVQTDVKNILTDVYGSIISISFSSIDNETLKDIKDDEGNLIRVETGTTGQLRFMYSEHLTTEKENSVTTI